MAEQPRDDLALEHVCVLLEEVAVRLRHMARSPWPELPNREGSIEPTGLTALEVEQGREPPPGCDPKGGEGDICDDLADIERRAGYHPGSAADPRD